MAFIEVTTMGDRNVRIARVYEARVYALYDMLKVVRDRHNLAAR